MRLFKLVWISYRYIGICTNWTKVEMVTFYDVPFLVWERIYISVINIRRELKEAGADFETLYCPVYKLTYKS